MKALRLLALIAACMVCLYASSQDMIVTNEGTALKVYNLEVSSNSVFYQLEDKPDAPIQKILKSDILIIKKADGTKLDFSAPTQPTAPAATPAASQSGVTKVTVENLSAEAKAANEALIAKYNQIYDTNVGEIKKNSNAGWAYGRLGVTNKSVLENEDIAINIETGYAWEGDQLKLHNLFEYSSPDNVRIQFSISNKTDNTIYIDLGNTFYVSMGQSFPYYVPVSTTTSSGSSSGAGVNAGAIAGALGIGGGLATLAGGINIGGGKSNATTTTTFSQRVIALPPHSTHTLEPCFMFGDELRTICQGFSLRRVPGFHVCAANFNDENGGRMAEYDVYSYSEQSSPLQMSFVTAYSKTEDFSSSCSIQAGLYLKEMYGEDLFRTMMKTGKLPTKIEGKSKTLLDQPVLAIKIKLENNKNQPSFPKQ